jgi:ABC-type antimicrobial peptide transport system permease subunit
LAAIIAIVLINILMPLYNNISGKDLHFSFANKQMWQAIGYAIMGMLLASSIYPAILLSSFRPIQSLKGEVTSGIGNALFRKILVVFQFGISVILIAGTLIMNRQMHYIRNKNLGFDKSYVFTVPLTNNLVQHIDAVKNELRKQRGIINIATSNIYDISNYGNATGDIGWPAKTVNSNMIIGDAVVDKDFIPTMKMQFAEGENFSGTPADSTHYIVNEAAVEAMGLKPPYVGQPISLHNKKGTIIGVLKDFNFKSLKEKITPLLFYLGHQNGNFLYVRTTAQQARQAIAEVKNQYRKYSGDVPFSYSFVDKQFEAKYESDRQAGFLFNLFAGIAIFISCLGLLGLATFTAQRRRKEIGIRKVLGAGVGNIIRLISMDFLKLVFVAIVIGTPIAWLVMNKWLQNFAYRTNISWWIFVVVGLVAILIALITVSWQAVRAAIANPVKSLRTE